MATLQPFFADKKAVVESRAGTMYPMELLMDEALWRRKVSISSGKSCWKMYGTSDILFCSCVHVTSCCRAIFVRGFFVAISIIEIAAYTCK